MIKMRHLKKDNIILICDRIIEFSLYLVIFTSTFSKAAVESFFGLALLAYLFKKSLSFSIGNLKTLFPSTKLDFPLLAFISANILSTILSRNFLVSAKSLVTVLIENIAFYLMTLEVISSQKEQRRGIFIKVIILTCIVIIADSAFQYFTGRDMFRHFAMSGPRLTASLGSPNTFGAWLVLVTPLICCIAVMAKIKKMILRIGMLALSCLLILCIFLSYSRAAWIGFFVAVLFIMLSGDRRMFRFFLMLIAFFFLFISMYPDSLSILFNSKYATYPILIRFNLWEEAIAMIKDYPLFGVGFKNYLDMIPKYQIYRFNISISEIGETTGISPHNGYLQMAAETGLIGLGCFLWLLYALFRNGINSLKRKPDPALLGLLSGLLAFLVSAFFDNHLNKVDLSAMFWIMFALVAGFLKKEK